MLDRNELFESTMYAGHGYGSRLNDVESIISSGKTVLAVMDICGAMSMKTNFPNVVIVYVRREKRDLLEAILDKKCSNQEKVNRIISIDDEKRNEEICDFVINNLSADESAEIIVEHFLKRA